MAKTKDEKDQSATQPEVEAVETVENEAPAEAVETQPGDVYVPEVGPEPEFDTSEANDIGHVPDPPFYGRYQLHADVDFANAEGGETHVAAGVINGHELPVDVAETLAARGLLTKV